MKIKEIENLSVRELNQKLLGLKKDLFDLKMKNGLGQLSNPLQIRTLRKDVARVLTILGNKES